MDLHPDFLHILSADGPWPPVRAYENLTRLAATTPELAQRWQTHLVEKHPDASPQQLNDLFNGLSYQDTAVFIDYLLEKLLSYDTASFPAVFALIEQLLGCDDHRTEELTSLGLLEGLQNRLIAASLDQHTAFDAWLLPASKATWDALNASWDELSNHQQSQRRLYGQPPPLKEAPKTGPATPQ